MNPPTAGLAEQTPSRRLRCVLDASVLYQEVLRNLLLWIAAQGGIPELLGRLAGLGRGDTLAPQFAALAAAKLDVEVAAPPG